MEIKIKPIPSSELIFMRLEEKGVITRICPGHDPISVPMGDADYKEVYHTDIKFGSHKLISVTVNSKQPSKFVYHSAKEDFLLIDYEHTEKLILTVALYKEDIINEKIRNKTISEDDFMAIICEKNHPFFSFFTMNPGFAHTETCHIEGNNPPSFYVTEPHNIDEISIDFADYSLVICDN